MAGLSGVLQNIQDIYTRLTTVEGKADTAATDADAAEAAAAAVTVMAGRLAPYKRVITTGADGLWSKIFPANFFPVEPLVLLTPKMAATNFEWAYQITGSVSGGFTVAVTATRRKNSITGILSLIGLIDTPVATTFSIFIGDQTADV